MGITMEELEKNWEEILQRVKKEHDLTNVTFDTWVKPLKVYAVKDGCAYILVNGEQMGLSYITQKYTLPLKMAIAEVTGTKYEIEFILPEQTEEAANLRKEKAPWEDVVKEAESNLNSDYTFGSFFADNNNRHAYVISQAVADSPGEVYNPLFIYGDPELGKTHLLHAIAHEILRKDPDRTVLYVPAEIFIDESTKAIRSRNNSEMAQFRDKYQNVDVLLIDDVQLLSGQEPVQEEFFHIFNRRHIEQKQMVFASDRSPEELENMEERLCSRFQWGEVAQITPHPGGSGLDIYGFFNSKDIAEH
ncbi:MAG: ATP-binding protein, partial [Bacteroidales bacterium]|nr:ATP-binding protein [Bacteroidales bacterium]